MKNDVFHIKNGGLYMKNDGFDMKNDNFLRVCKKKMKFSYEKLANLYMKKIFMSLFVKKK
jgi:hypothetical protein